MRGGVVGYLIYGRFELLNDSYYLVYGDSPYRDSLRLGVMWRLAYYLLGFLISLAVVCVTPSRRVAPMAYLGERTLQIYVVHRLLRPFLSHLGFYGLPMLQDELLAPIVVVAATCVLVLVSLVPVFGTVLNAFMRMRWGVAVVKQTSK